MILTRQFLPVIYQAGVKALFHCLCRLSWLNLKLLAVISSRECAAAAAPDYFCLCSGFYAFCFTHWQGLLLILKKGWRVRCPTPPSPCGLAQQDSALCGEPFSTPPDLSKSFFLYWKHTFLLTKKGFSLWPRHVNDFQNRSKWCLYRASLALNRCGRQCTWYLPRFPPSCTIDCFCVVS